MSQSSENLSSPTANDQTNGNSNGGGGGNSEDSSSNKKNKKPVAPPRSQKSDAKNNVSGLKGSKSSFNLDPRPSSGRPSSGRPSSSRPGRYVC